DADLDVSRVQRVEHLHLVGDLGDVDHLGGAGMKALERAARMLGVEGAGADILGIEIVEQRARDRGLADAALVGANQENDGLAGAAWVLLAHPCTLAWCRACFFPSFSGPPPIRNPRPLA